MEFLHRMQRPGQTLLGVTLASLGTMLLGNTSAAIALLLALLCSGLVLVGVLRFIEALQSTRWRPVHLTAAMLLVVSGVVLLLWRTASLPVLALIVSLVLLVSGIARLLSTVGQPRGSRWRGLLSALTGLFASVLVLFWPRLSLWVVAVTFGCWLILLGLHTLYLAWADRLPAAPRWPPRLTRFGHGVLTATGLLLTLGLGVVTAQLYASSPHTAPDEFYLPPASVPEQPGQLVRAEPLERGVPAAARAWRILYPTTDHIGEPSLSSGVVTVPAQGGTNLPVVSWGNGIKGVQPRCALSLADNPYEDGPSRARTTMLDAGWAIVATDYPGLGTSGPHPYLVPQAEAAAILDATRAAGQLKQFTLSERTVFWGHSQGGHAALSAAAYAPDYAPEFTVLGTAAMAPASDLPLLAASVADSAAGKVISSYIATSWDELYPQLDILQGLQGSTTRSLERIGANCFSGSEVLSALAEASQLFEPIFPVAVLDGPVGDRLMDNSAPQQVPGPVFLAQGGGDSLVTPAMQRSWRDAACTQGTQIFYREYPGLEHMGLVGEESSLNDDLVSWTLNLDQGGSVEDNCRS